MLNGYIKVSAGAPRIVLADVNANADAILDLIHRADAAGAHLLVLPELCLTGATCGDLFYSDTLLTAAEDALVRLAEASAACSPVTVVGLPLRSGGRIYNCSAVLHKGNILGVVPRGSIPGWQRQFAAPAALTELELNGQIVPFGPELRFDCEDMSDFRFSVITGDDAVTAASPAAALCAAGAVIIANPCAVSEIVGAARYRNLQLQAESARLLCSFVSSNAGEGESTQDAAYAGHCIIFEKGRLLAQNPPFGDSDLIISEIDVQRLAAERRRMPEFSLFEDATSISFSMPVSETGLTRHISCTPFIPENEPELSERMEHILRIQSHALKHRIEHIHARSLVVGISGGLDSCLALLVMIRALDLLGRSHADVAAFSMPCFGTTGRTRSNAEKLCEQLGVRFKELPIADAVRQHFADIGHDENVRDVTYENSQARERTQILMDLSNELGGMVVGTGDLSELALGWATYNGDHMSMYGVNAGIPKTLVRALVRYEARRLGGELAAILLDILDTPVSPELLPADEDDKIQQKTEDLVGPYELHDFFLFYAVRCGFSPKKIFRLAKHAFDGAYSDEVILKWLRTFFRRFFMQQFKRSCLPDGPKIGTVSLSPRGDWQMPTDALSTLWLKEIDSLQ